MELKNSTILITGGTSGIGLEFVRQLTYLDAKIIVTGRNLHTLEETKKRFPKTHIFQSDVSEPESIERLYAEVVQQFPELNIMINNAGLMRQIDLQDNAMDLLSINQEIATNLTGTIQMTHKFLPHLRTKASAAIINVTSSIAYLPYSIAPIYSASKAGAHAYTKVLRLQLEDSTIKVFEILPPGVRTNLQNHWELPPPEGRMMDVEKMVIDAIDGILRDRPEITPGLAKTVKVLGRILPNTLMKYGHGEFRKLKQSRVTG